MTAGAEPVINIMAGMSHRKTSVSCFLSIAVVLALLSVEPAEAQKVSLLLDWGWIPYHTVFLTAEDRGFYRDAGLEVTIEQGRGSATTAIVVGQGSFDIGHLNITNAAQAIGKGVPLKVVAIYQHRTAASFIGIKGKVQLKDPQSLKGLKIGSTPGGSDGLSLTLFSKLNSIPLSDLNIVALDANTKRVALLDGTVDVVSGDSHAFGAIVRGSGREPEFLMLADYGVPLLGFGFAVNETFVEREPQAIKKFLAATKRGFQAAVENPQAACQLIQSKVFVGGSREQCVDYFMGLMALSQAPTDPNWGRQSTEEWEKLVSTLKSVGEIESDKKPADYFTNDFVP